MDPGTSGQVGYGFTLVPFVLVGILGVDPAASLEVTLKECHVLPESEPSLTKKASKSEHSLVQAFGAQFFRSVHAATAVFLPPSSLATRVDKGEFRNHRAIDVA